MDFLIKLKFGSHLYGTNTPTSDLDVKGIYLPKAKDILLQSIAPVCSFSRPKSHGEKNSADDIDQEFYSPSKYVSLLMEGQMLALDIFFAPDSAMLVEPSLQWHELKKLAPFILSKKANAVVRYCRKQANKYGIKGSRVAAAKLALKLLREEEAKHDGSKKLSQILLQLENLANDNEHLILGEHISPNNLVEKYFEICGRKALLNASIKNAMSIAQKLVDSYGQRAMEAEKNQGVDWKALSHAVRAGYQMIEFMQEEFITFPRPEADYLVAIKQGKIPFKTISQELEELLIKVDDASKYSQLKEEPDIQMIENFITGLYSKIILKDYSNDSSISNFGN